MVLNTRIIAIEEYNEQWSTWFTSIATFLRNMLTDLPLDIVHVGITSVKGLKSKPIIDIDIIARRSNYQQIIDKLAQLGYVHEGTLGIEGREAFGLENKDLVNQLPSHHLYLCHPGSKGLENHLYLKEYLKVHPDAVQQYGSLKETLAKQFRTDIDSYIDGKSNLINLMIENARKEIILEEVYPYLKPSGTVGL